MGETKLTAFRLTDDVLDYLNEEGNRTQKIKDLVEIFRGINLELLEKMNDAFASDSARTINACLLHVSMMDEDKQDEVIDNYLRSLRKRKAST